MYSVKRKNKYLAIFTTFIMIAMLLPVGVFAEESKTDVKPSSGVVTMTVGEKGYTVDGVTSQADVEPYLEAGRVMVPVAFVAPALGSKSAMWYPAEQKVEVEKDGIKTYLWIGKTYMEVNGERIAIDVPARIQTVGKGGRTMLPISWVAKALNVEYSWDNDSKQVSFYKMTTYDKSGTYGPEKGSEVINGSVAVKAPNTTLQNLVIKGDLIIAESVGTGDVTLKNVTVEGKTYVRGGGKNSIHIIGGQYNGNIVIENTAEGGTRISVVNAQGVSVVIATGQAGEKVILEGAFKSVEVNAANANIVTQGNTTIASMTVNTEGSKIELAQGTTVSTFTANATVAVNGTGKITTANVNASGVSFSNPPTKVDTANGVKPPNTGTTNSGGDTGGGSSSGGKTTKKATIEKIDQVGMPTSEIKVKVNGSYQNSYKLLFDDIELTSTTNGTVVVADAMLSDISRLKISVDGTVYSGSTLSFE